jgi:hypothetical protein
MAKLDREKAKDLMARMKVDVRAILEKYAAEAADLSVNSDDPHSPVIGCVQMALANAAAQYMSFCGATPLEGFNVTVNITGQAMKHWVNAVMQHSGLKPANDPVPETTPTQ